MISINKLNNPVMDEVLQHAFRENPWDYRSTDDYLANGIDNNLGTALNREIDSSPDEVVSEFYKLMPEWG